MATRTDSPLERFVWTPQPEAAQFVEHAVAEFCAVREPAAQLAKRLSDEAGTRLLDWVDHLGLKHSPANVRKLGELGFEPAAAGSQDVWRHPEGLFPSIHLYHQAERGWPSRSNRSSIFSPPKGWKASPSKGLRWPKSAKPRCSVRRMPNSGSSNVTAPATVLRI